MWDFLTPKPPLKLYIWSIKTRIRVHYKGQAQARTNYWRYWKLKLTGKIEMGCSKETTRE